VSSTLPQRMVDPPETPEPFSLKRWSQRKRVAARGAHAEATPAPAASVPATTNVAESAPAPAVESAPLPTVESLTFDSDFSAFMQPKVAEETKRAALRKLFSDPSFNVMDGLDIYVGDYTQADPMPAGMLEKLSTVYGMLDRVDTARGEPAASPPPSTSEAAPAARAESGALVEAESRPASPAAAPGGDDAAADELRVAPGTRQA